MHELQANYLCACGCAMRFAPRHLTELTNGDTVAQGCTRVMKSGESKRLTGSEGARGAVVWAPEAAKQR